MRRLMMKTVAIAALVLAPTLALAQGGPGGDRGGPDAGGHKMGQGGQGGHEGGREQGGDRMKGGNGPGQAMHGNGGEGRDRGDGHDRGGDRMRGDNDRGAPAVRGDNDRRDPAVRGDRERPVVERRDDRGVVERRGGERRARVITSEQRTQVRTRFRGLGGERIRGGDFAVRVGAPLPGRYRFSRLPREIVDIVPEYEGYDYVLVDNEVLIIDPETRQIVSVLD